MQAGLFAKALAVRDNNTRAIDDWKSLEAFFEKEGGGFALVGWDGTPETEAKMKDELKATIRCIAEVPNPAPAWAEKLFEKGKCVVSGKESARRVVVARAY
jgi:prolyl-tRNA synthetase